MEGFEFDVAPYPSESTGDVPDFCDSVLARFGNSPEENHQRLCAVIGAMSQELLDQNLPRTSVAYFAAACSSLDRLLSASPPESHVVSSLLILLSMLLPSVPAAVLRKKREFLSETLMKALQCDSLSTPAVASGLKCISHLVIAGGDGNWSTVSQFYGVLLRSMTDSRPKVRRQAHLSLRDVLQNLRGTSSLAPASEGITIMFERFLLLAGGSKTDAMEEPKGAQEVLYVLDALKECLPHMSLKYTNTMLKYFKTLLELRKPLVTRRVTDSLSVVCLDPTSEVSPEGLLDLLCSLANSVSSEEASSVDAMTFTARLLDSGIKKVYSLNRQVCVIKLPSMVNALRDIIGSEHEEAIFAATEAFKNIINACIDDNLIRQGVDQMRMNMDMEGRRSGPTIIEKICATVESLLDYRFSAVWDMALQVVSTTFDKLGSHSAYLMRGTLKSLADLQKLPDEDFPFRKQLHECVGSALVAMGPETFLSLLPLKLEADDLSEVNVWLFPILKQHTVGAHLSYFTESVLGTVRLIRQKARKFELEGRVFSSRSADALIYSLWSLLPSFCNYAVDTADTFNDLKTILCTTMDEEDLRVIICISLQLLIEQNKRFLDGHDPSYDEVGLSKKRAMSRYNLQVATDNLDVLRSSARDFFPVMSRIFLKSPKDDGGCLQSTISAFSSIADKRVVSRLFTSTMKKVLKITEESAKRHSSDNSSAMQTNGSSRESSPSFARAKLIDLAVSLLPGLNEDEIAVLFKAIQPVLKDKDEGLVQKKAYKVLWTILKNCEGFLLSKLEELLKFMLEVRSDCHFSARRHRLECLYFLVVGSSKDVSENTKWESIGFLLADIVVALKDANKKTRNRAYDILVEIGHACGDEERGGRKENLLQLFNKIAANLTSGVPHMISAAMKGLARLTYEFSDLISCAFSVLPSTFHLSQVQKNREIIKANLGLLKVLVAKSQSNGLQMHLDSMVKGLLNWQDDTRKHFKSKIKVLLEMLIKKCGIDAVRAVLPEEHMRLLRNVRKIKERKERKRSTSSEESRSHHSLATTSRLSRWNHTKIFSDSGDEESEDNGTDYMDAETITGKKSKASSVHLKSNAAASLRTKRLRKGAKSLPEDLLNQLEDEPLDLLDRQKTRSALKSADQQKRKAESDDEMEIDPEGRLVIREGVERPRRRASSPLEPFSDTNSEAAFSHHSIGSSRKSQQKKRRTSDSGWAYTGGEYASKKASGDVKRKDKLEPYAYWPLDRKMMSRRPEHRAAARKGMASVVKMTKMLEGKSASGALAIKSRPKLKKSYKKGSKNKAK